MVGVNYVITKVETEFGEAKIATFNNEPLQKKSNFPSVMFHIQSNEDVNAIKQYYFQRLPSERIFGFVFSYYRLANLIPQMNRIVPSSVNYMCDLNPEILWDNKLKESVMDYYLKSPPIPEKYRGRIKGITSIADTANRIVAYDSFLEDLCKDRSSLTSLLTATVNRQHGYLIDNISSFSPMLITKDHIDYTETFYKHTKRLYHSVTNDLEQNGKLVGLYSCFHPLFLSHRENISEYLKMLERVEPKAIMFKFYLLGDIRQRKRNLENYRRLVKGIADVGSAMSIPTFYFSAHMEGYLAQTKGIDVFAEPYNHDSNIERKMKRKKEDIARQRQQDPLCNSGKIYDMRNGNLIPRSAFQKNRLTKTGVDSPVKFLSSYNPDVIRGMTDGGFREFSKLLLMESRNHEEVALHKAIDDGSLKEVNQKLAKWLGADIPK